MTRSCRTRSGAILFVVAVATTISWGASAQSFSADAFGAGTLVAWLSGLELAASIEGKIHLAGEAALDGRSVPFSAEGTLLGFGVRGITTLISQGWIGYEAAGHSTDGEPIEIRGLLYAWRRTLIALRAGDAFVGAHRTVVVFAGEAHSFRGEFSGTVEGGLEPAETPGTIRLDGTGTVHLEGEPGESPASIPLDHPALTPEFLQYVTELGL
jgi:hypothetical protein